MTDNSTLITKVAKAMLNGVYNRKTAWDEFTEDHLSFERKATHALEFLASTGRLVPDDDDVIDAEVYGLRKNGDWLLSSNEVDDLRIAWEAVKGYRVDGYARPHVNRLVQVVGRLFAATEHAECEFRCEEGIARARVGVRCPACTAAMRDKEATEPAEEETEAEAAVSHCWDMESYAAGSNAGFDEAMRQISGVDIDDEITEPWSITQFAAMSEIGDRVFEIDMDRGGAEEAIDCIVGGRLVTREVYYGAWRLADTASWPSLLAVPKSVVAVRDRNGDEWTRGSNGAFCLRAGCGNGHPDFAPFVAVEEAS